MSERHWRPLLLRLGSEMTLWYCLPIAFLAIYVTLYAAPAAAVLPHLQLIALCLLALAALRLAADRWLPGLGARLLSASLAASLAASLLLYYGLTIIGLNSWGRVISWSLITTYAAQALDLAASLGLSSTAVLAGAGCAYVGLTLLAFLYLARFDWVPLLARRFSGGMLAFATAAASGTVAIGFYQFSADPWIQQAEPVSLTFFPRQATRTFQSQAIDSAEAGKRDQLEDAARAAYRPNPAAARRNVILIVVDALRPDHMGVNGYARDTTPNLSRLAKAGVVRNLGVAHASCSESSCGLLSLASSKYVHQFSSRPFTLQQVLVQHGYRIHLILGGDHTNFYGLKESYGKVDSYFDGSSAQGYYMNDDQLVSDHLAAFAPSDGTPVMMQFHLMSAHPLGKRHPDALRYQPVTNYARTGIRSGLDVPTASTLNFYDNGVVQVDIAIASLLEILGRKGYLRDALVVITADHGEHLGEHGTFGHGNSVDEPALRVPLLFLSYGYQPAALAARRMAAQVDIAPTILAELGMPIPATWVGQPLQHPGPAPFSFFQQGAKVGLIDHRQPGGPWKYWINARTSDEHAYDLGADPAESRNLIDTVAAERKQEWRLRVLPGAAQSFSRL